MTILGSDVGKSRIDGESKLIPLQHHTTMLVGRSALTKLRAKKGIAVQKNRHQSQQHAVLFAESFDRLLHHAQIK